MKIKETLQWILRYYDATRGVGHTRLMLEGKAYLNNGVMITHTKEYGEKIIKSSIGHGRIKIESLNSLNNLLGKREAIAFDNCALYILFTNVLGEINNLEEDNERLKYYINTLELKIRKAKDVLNQ
jgi:hypothetical protein